MTGGKRFSRGREATIGFSYDSLGKFEGACSVSFKLGFSVGINGYQIGIPAGKYFEQRSFYETTRGSES